MKPKLAHKDFITTEEANTMLGVMKDLNWGPEITKSESSDLWLIKISKTYPGGLSEITLSADTKEKAIRKAYNYVTREDS